MRILHIVTLVSSRGAFGGPTAVAHEHCAELTRRGHDVTFVAGVARNDDAVSEVGSSYRTILFPVSQLIPRVGFVGLFSAEMLKWLAGNARHYDIVHVHMGRDLISQSACWIIRASRTPYLVQSHGMIPERNDWLSRSYDLLTTRPLLRAAHRVLFLTATESDDLARQVGSVNLLQIDNGVGLKAPSQTVDPQRPLLDVLFCSRLHERKRPVTFVRAAIQLLRDGVPATFSLAGPDQGELPKVQELIRDSDLGDSIFYEGALSPAAARARICLADAVILPSLNEPFPMTILESMALGTPTVVTRSCEIASSLAKSRASLVCDVTEESLREAMRTLIESSSMRKEIEEAGRHVVDERYSISVVVTRLLDVYMQALKQGSK